MKFLSLCLGLALLSGCAAASDDAATQAGAIQGGSVDSAAHGYAVGIANKLGTVCSGTLIAQNLVLTARHCVVDPDGKDAVTCADSFGANTDVANLFVTTDPVLNGKANLYAVAEIATPTDPSFCGNDIALVRLAKSIAGVTPAIPVVQFSITDQARLNGQIAAVGYGNTAPNANDPGTRHVREDIAILCVPGDSKLDCTKTPYTSMLDDRNNAEFITQGYVCAGDSGGGAFDQTSFAAGGAPYVLGALSRGPSNDTECLAAIYSRTDVHADLITATAKKAAQLGGYTPASWVTGDSTPTIGTTSCSGAICTTTDATDPTSSDEAPAAAAGCSAAPGSRPGWAGLVTLSVVIAAVLRRRRP